MSDLQREIAIIAVGALTIMATRFLPFLIFGGKGKAPEQIQALGKVLPFALMGMLVVYCLKDVTPLAYPYGIPELIGIATVVGLHIWKRNYLISIAAGTVVYMLLVQLVFV